MNERGIDELIAKYAKEWMERFNAIGVARGIKMKGGRPTGEEAIVFFVTKKLPESLFMSGLRLGFEMIPKILEGFKTDVIEVPEGFSVRADDARYRPVKGGVAVINARASGTGTLGVINEKGEILSNNHVLALASTEKCNLASKGDPIIQPGTHGGGRYPDDVIGYLDRWTPIRVAGVESPCGVGRGFAKLFSMIPKALGRRGVFKYVYSFEPNLYDAAVGVMSADVEYEPDAIVGTLLKVDGAKTAKREIGARRWKRGRTTEATTGRIQAIDVAVQVGGYACGGVGYDVGQVAIVGDTGSFSAPGDSGSLVVEPGEDELVATELLFAGGRTGDGMDITIASPLEYVIDGLGFRLP